MPCCAFQARWQCIAIVLIALCAPSLLTIRAMQHYADRIVDTQRRAIVASKAGGAQTGASTLNWHDLTVSDLMCYMKRYDDLKDEYGFDPTKLLQHYVQYGKDEGRDPHCAEGGLPEEDTSGRPQASTIPEQAEETEPPETKAQSSRGLLTPRQVKERDRAELQTLRGAKLEADYREHPAPISRPSRANRQYSSRKQQRAIVNEVPMQLQADEQFDELGPLRDIMTSSSNKHDFVTPIDAVPRTGRKVERDSTNTGAISRIERDINPMQSTFQITTSEPVSLTAADRRASPRLAAKMAKLDQNAEQFANFFGTVKSSKATVPAAGYRKCRRNKNLPQSPCMPAFLVIGAQKSGTSTLAHLMGQHPQIMKPKVKEILFFNWNNDFKIKCNPKQMEISGYFQQFPIISPAKFEQTGAITGEWSATYLPCHCCAATVFRTMPSAKIIAILRHPIDRAHSRFTEQVFFAKKFKKKEINNCPVWMGWEKFVDHGLRKLQTCLQSAGLFANAIRECIHHNNELGWSIYSPSITEWITQFGSDQVKVIFTETLQTDPQHALRDVEDFLEINNYHLYKDVNASMNSHGKYGWAVKDKKATHEGSKSKMSATAYKKLISFYHPYMIELHKMAENGAIDQLPVSWREEWRLGAR